MNFRQGTLVQTLASAGVLALFSGCGDDGKAESETAVISDTETSTGPTAGSTEPTSGTTTGETTEAPTTSSSTTDDTGTSTTGPIIPPAYDQWLTIPLEGAVCGNNSQYKIFVNFHEGAKDLLVMLEPGGACWDFDTCSGKAPLGAAHPDGIPDDLLYDPLTKNLSPLMRRDVEGLTKDWNFVFIPYCTGDVHTGNNVITYKDPNGVEPDLVYHHNGHNNIMAATEWMATQFPGTDRLFVTGCSAGGAGSLINYHFFRSRIDAKRGYLMDDSGPIFPSTGNSGPLHDMIRVSWNVDSVLSELPRGYEIKDDFGVLNLHLADLYPEDRLSTVFFQRDYNFSRYSYERFYPDMNKEKILEFWAEDTDLLTALYDPLPNMAYYLPYWRGLNDSHCVSIISYLDTEIEEQNVDLGDFIADLLDDDKPLVSYRESVQPNEDK
jgi:hypothetical protein